MSWAAPVYFRNGDFPLNPCGVPPAQQNRDCTPKSGKETHTASRCLVLKGGCGATERQTGGPIGDTKIDMGVGDERTESQLPGNLPSRPPTWNLAFRGLGSYSFKGTLWWVLWQRGHPSGAFEPLPTPHAPCCAAKRKTPGAIREEAICEPLDWRKGKALCEGSDTSEVRGR